MYAMQRWQASTVSRPSTVWRANNIPQEHQAVRTKAGRRNAGAPFRQVRVRRAGDCHVSRTFRCNSVQVEAASDRGAEPDAETTSEAGRQQKRDTLMEGSSWDAMDASGSDEEGQDYLYQLGKGSANTNTQVGAREGLIDSAFTGGFLGRDSDIASGALRNFEIRKLAHLEGDYYIPPGFLDKFSLHIAKNYLAKKFQGHVPLVLGIWGPKGCGKSFQVELCCREMGIEPIIMSAGELEDEWAGEPGRLIRARYRAAAQMVKNSGKMSCLIINDLDAGVGRFRNTQTTVNAQIVCGTLMNLCDQPEQISVGQEWGKDLKRPRIPIIITANDLGTLYAPLLRDGRMEKFCWSPSKADLVPMVHRMLMDGGYTEADISALLDEFPGQPLDFYGALHSRLYDSAIRAWCRRSEALAEAEGGTLGRWLDRELRRAGPERRIAHDLGGTVDLSLEKVLAEGRALVQEQQHVLDHTLSKEYLRWQQEFPDEPERVEVSEEERADMAARRDAARERLEASKQRSMDVMQRTEKVTVSLESTLKRQVEEEKARRREAEERAAAEAEAAAARQWPAIDPIEAQALREESASCHLLDIRSVRDFNRETAHGAISAPAVKLTGRPLQWRQEADPEFLAVVGERCPAKEGTLLVLAGGGEECEATIDFLQDAMLQLQGAGYTDVREVLGGYDEWRRCWTPGGKKRPPEGKYATDHNSAGTVCVGSDFDPVSTL